MFGPLNFRLPRYLQVKFGEKFAPRKFRNKPLTEKEKRRREKFERKTLKDLERMRRA